MAVLHTTIPCPLTFEEWSSPPCPGFLLADFLLSS